MIIKDIAKQEIPEIGNILPLKKNNIIPIKIDKSIEIVVVPNLGEVNSHQDNVGIILEEKNVLRILSKRYKNVLITEINSEVKTSYVSDPNTTYNYTVKEDYSNSLKLELGFDLNLIDSWYFATSIRRLIKNNKDFENEFAIKVSKPF